jgi:rhodanese-related sulfurtransferase
MSGCPEAKPENFDGMVTEIYSFSVPVMQPEQLSYELQRNNSIVVLDARELTEYNVSHLKNALVVGYDDVDLHALDTVAKDTKVVVYCSVGYRSERVGEQLLERGFTNVHNLYGGIFDWINNEYPVYSGDTITTDTVHGYNKNWGQWCFKGVKVY